VGDVKLWQIPGGREVARFPVDSPCVWRVAFSPDGRRLAAACGVHAFGAANTFSGVPYTQATTARVKAWDVETLLEVLHVEGTHQPFRCVAFSPDGLSLLACDRTGTIRLFGRRSDAWSARVER
jgi:WD40 repeat protein